MFNCELNVISYDIESGCSNTLLTIQYNSKLLEGSFGELFGFVKKIDFRIDKDFLAKIFWVVIFRQTWLRQTKNYTVETLFAEKSLPETLLNRRKTDSSEKESN
jgi:hypothetical protein